MHLMQRPDIAKLPREELAIWWQPEMIEHLIAGLCKAGLEVQGTTSCFTATVVRQNSEAAWPSATTPDEIKPPRKA
jgi:hypothetical protein